MNLLVVDDHPIFRQGLRMLLRTISGELQVDEAGDTTQALEIARARPCDIVLLDLKLPGINGMAALETFRDLLPGIPVVVVSGESEPGAVREAIERGAVGFIPKSLPPERFVEALTQVLDRKIYLPAEALRPPRGAASGSVPELTARQMDVVRRVVLGRSNKEIARDLGLSAETVKSHLTRAMRALDASNRTELVYIAARRGLRLG